MQADHQPAARLRAIAGTFRKVAADSDAGNAEDTRKRFDAARVSAGLVRCEIERDRPERWLGIADPDVLREADEYACRVAEWEAEIEALPDDHAGDPPPKPRVSPRARELALVRRLLGELGASAPLPAEVKTRVGERVLIRFWEDWRLEFSGVTAEDRPRLAEQAIDGASAITADDIRAHAWAAEALADHLHQAGAAGGLPAGLQAADAGHSGGGRASAELGQGATCVVNQTRGAGDVEESTAGCGDPTSGSDPFMPASWFFSQPGVGSENWQASPGAVYDRLAKASLPDRKKKRVRRHVRPDGTVLFSANDARVNWPELFERAAARGK